MDQRVTTIRQALAALADIPDDEEAARVIGEALALIKEANGDLAKLRRDKIVSLRATGRTYKEIGEAIGMHFSRVRQIEKEIPSGNSSRSRASRGEGT